MTKAYPLPLANLRSLWMPPYSIILLHCYLVLNQSVLWIVGGVELNTSEFISLSQPPMKGPDLPFTIFSFSMIQFNANSIFIIGGLQNGSISNKTWIVNPANFEIKEGPSMNFERCRHSCGKMNIDGKTIIVVAGGTGSQNTGDSVEILDPNSNEGWILGKMN